MKKGKYAVNCSFLSQQIQFKQKADAGLLLILENKL